MKPILITLFLLLSACSTQQSIVYSSTWKQEHDEEITTDCKNEAIKITLVLYEVYNREWSEDDVMRVEHLIFMSCLKYNNLVI